MNVGEVGSYIREQRLKGQLSLRKLSAVAGVSIPYLSQVERGLRKPSADILHAIAKALRISAGTLYVRAGILEDSPVPDVAASIMADPLITERHRQALLQIYEAFRDEAGRASAVADAEVATNGSSPAARMPRRRPVHTAGSTARLPRSTTTSAAARPKRARGAGTAGGGAKSKAGNSPHPAPLRPSTTNRRKEV